MLQSLNRNKTIVISNIVYIIEEPLSSQYKQVDRLDTNCFYSQGRLGLFNLNIFFTH